MCPRSPPVAVAAYGRFSAAKPAVVATTTTTRAAAVANNNNKTNNKATAAITVIDLVDSKSQQGTHARVRCAGVFDLITAAIIRRVQTKERTIPHGEKDKGGGT
jgi:hypothetical protein